METSLLENKDRNKAKIYAWIATVLYILIFLPILQFAAITGIVADSPTISRAVVYLILFFTFCVPLSMPISIYFVWSRYLKKKYKSSRRFCFVPFYAMANAIFWMCALPFH
jgi:hypothetical protein